MTQEEKARAYDEALERAKMILCNIPEGSASVRDIGTIFPQLRESEDEKKVKGFIDTLRKASCFAGNEYLGVEIADCIGWFIDWLEKQKEQQSIQDKEEREYVRTLKSLISDFLRGKNEIDRGYYQKIYDWLDGRHIEPKEQKPVEWSEEDEKTISDACCWIAEYAGYLMDKNYGKASMLMGLVDRLKSLRPQPKQEWDAHDKAIVNCIVCCLDGQFVPESARKQSLVWFNKHRRDFLNSPHWKPTEEQMKALKRCVDGWTDDGDGTLDSLYNDLKKLM